MTNAHAILIGLALIAAALWWSNSGAPAGAQSAVPVIPPVEAWVPAADGGPTGPWHLWRMNRHTGQLSFCIAALPSGAAAPAGGQTGPTVSCTSTTSPM